MNTPDPDPYWLETLELSIVAIIVSLARPVIWTDPKTGTFSLWQTVQAIATAVTIATLAAGSQEEWHFPWPITVVVAVFGSMVGIPVILAGALQIWNTVIAGLVSSIRNKVGGDSNARSDGGSHDKS